MNCRLRLRDSIIEGLSPSQLRSICRSKKSGLCRMTSWRRRPPPKAVLCDRCSESFPKRVQPTPGLTRNRNRRLTTALPNLHLPEYEVRERTCVRLNHIADEAPQRRSLCENQPQLRNADAIQPRTNSTKCRSLTAPPRTTSTLRRQTFAIAFV